jgi:hypothetical protein
MTGAGSLSLDTQPVMDLRSALSLFSGRCGDVPAEGVGRDLGSAAGEGFPLPGSQIAATFPISGPFAPKRRGFWRQFGDAGLRVLSSATEPEGLDEQRERRTRRASSFALLHIPKVVRAEIDEIELSTLCRDCGP